MDRSRKTLTRWVLRCIGLGLVVVVVTTQVRLDDEIRLVDGAVLKGDVQIQPDLSYSVLMADGTVRAVPDSLREGAASPALPRR